LGREKWNIKERGLRSLVAPSRVEEAIKKNARCGISEQQQGDKISKKGKGGATKVSAYESDKRRGGAKDLR